MRTVLSTKKSLFDPFEVDVDGVIYTNRPFSKQLFSELQKLDSKAKSTKTPDGDKVSAVYDQIALIFGVPQAIAYQIDIRDVKELLDKIKSTIENPIKALKTEVEKNGSEPGEVESP